MIEPISFWLQWLDDAAREVLVSWYEEASAYSTPSLEYRKRGGGEAWATAVGVAEDRPYSEPGNPWGYVHHLVHHVHLAGLTPESEYEFRFTPAGPVRYFRTMPASLAGGRRVRGISGGDIRTVSPALVAQQFTNARTHDPDFMLIGGDWAYDNGDGSLMRYWDRILAWVTVGLTMPDGRVIPIVPVIGNHEVATGGGPGRQRAKPFFALFKFPEEHTGAYRTTAVGSHIAFVVLDSEHAAPRYDGGSAQERWLSQALADTAGRPYVIPAFHVPPYPCDRDENGVGEVRARRFICPLLEDAGVRNVLVFHDHTYARSKPMRVGRPNGGIGETHPDGIRYHGQGAIGVGGVARYDRPWLEEAYGNETPESFARAQHLHLLEFSEAELQVHSISRDNQIFHTHIERVAGGVEPEPPAAGALQIRTASGWRPVTRRLRSAAGWQSVATKLT